MIYDPLLLGVIGVIGFACVLSYFLGRWHGLEIGLAERFGPFPSSDWGCDCRTTELANDVFHFGTDTTGGQHGRS